MSFPDKSLHDMSMADLQRLIRQEVYAQIPPIPANVAALGDADSPLIFPPGSDDGEGLFYNSSTGQYEPNLVDAPNLAANIILATQLIAGDPNAARAEMGINANNETGVRAYDASSNNTFDLNAQDGSVYVKGRIDWGTASRLLSNDIMEMAVQTGSGFATPQRVQVAAKTYDGFASSNDVSGTSNISWNSATTNGSLLLLVVTQRTSHGNASNPILPTVSGWTQVQTVTGTDTTGGHMRQTIFKIENAASRSGNEGINFTGSSATRYFGARMYEYSGAGTVDVVATANTGTTVSTLGTTVSTNASGALAQAGEVLFAAFGSETDTNQPAGGFSDAGNTSVSHSVAHPTGTVTDVDLQCSELVTTSTTTQTATAIVSNIGFWMAQLVTFKASTATGTPTTPNAGVSRIYTNNNAVPVAMPHVLDSAGNANSVALAPSGATYRLQISQQTISIASVAAGATGSQTVSIAGLNIGDFVMWMGVAAGTPLMIWADPAVTVGGQFTLRYHNSDDGAAHALASTTHTFLIIHVS